MEMIPCPVPASNHEWLKILAATLGGLFVGLISEPVKGSVQWQMSLLKVKRAIALDFMMVAIGWATVKAEVIPWEKFWIGISLPGYDYYWSKNRELFYDGLDLYYLGLQCRVFEALHAGVAAGTITREEANERLERFLIEVQNKKRGNLLKRVLQKLRF